ICKATKLLCLGNKEHTMVKNIVNAVKGATGGGVNVIFEVMNEAPTGNGTSASRYSMWHDTVAQWIWNQGGYVRSASLGADANATNLGDCTYDSITKSGTCPNVWNVYDQPNIDMVAMHAIWYTNGTDVC